MKKFVISIALVLIVSVLAVSFVGCGGTFDDSMKKGDLEKKTSLNIREDGTFKILQFTDTHLIGNGKTDRDDQTLRWMKEAVEQAKPDLVELTGDITGSGTSKRNSGILAIANMFEEMGQYWAYSFGNHDGEWSKEGGLFEHWVGKQTKTLTKVEDVCPSIKDDPIYAEASKNYDVVFGDNTLGNQEIFDLLGGYEYCLSRQDPLEKESATRAAMGVGNYVIDLVDKAGDVKFGLIHMDTHGKMYANPKGNDIVKNHGAAADVGYVGLTDKQIEWYGVQAKRYADMGVKSAVFMHIPHYGFRESTEDRDTSDKAMERYRKYGIPQFKEKENIQDVVKDHLFEGISFVKEEGIYSCRWEDGLEGAIDRYKTTNLIAVGHDHNNCFFLKKDISGKYVEENESQNEIMIAYGRCSGVNAWGRKINIGATVYDINFNAQDSLESMYDVKTIYPSFDYVQEFEGENIHCKEPHLNTVG